MSSSYQLLQYSIQLKNTLLFFSWLQTNICYIEIAFEMSVEVLPVQLFFSDLGSPDLHSATESWCDNIGQSLFSPRQQPLSPSQWRRWEARADTLVQLAGFCQSTRGNQPQLFRHLLFICLWTKQLLHFELRHTVVRGKCSQQSLVIQLLLFPPSVFDFLHHHLAFLSFFIV